MRSRWLLLIVGWSVFGVVQTLMTTALQRDAGNALRALFAFYLPLAWVWALLTPVVGAWTRAVNSRFPSLLSRLAAHLPLLIATAMLHTAFRRALVVALGQTVAVPFSVTLLYFADLTVASYVAAVWAARALDANAKLVARDRQTHALRTQLVAAQMEYLELQLRPHFLFNALSTIAELAHEAPKSAARMLTNVVALLETAIARGGRGLVPLGEELEAVSPYLAIQRIRFADWLVIEEDVAENAKHALVPQFILQPLVENAVHHGLIDRSARGQIVIRARAQGERLLVTVTDNGVGLNTTRYQESRGLGLGNLRARLDAVYGGEATIRLSTDAGVGTSASLEIPLRTVGDASKPSPAEDMARSDADVRDIQNAEPSSHAKGALRWARAHPVLAAIAVWAAVAVLRVQHSYAYMMLRDRYTRGAFASAIFYDVTAAGLWLGLTPLVLWIVRAVPLRRARIGLRVLAHMVAAFGLAFAHTALTRVIVQDYEYPLWSGASSQVYAWNVSVYAIILVLAYFRDLDSWIREREVAADRLRKDLEEARFRRVMLELRPRVLLDTLRHLVHLVTENAKRSEKILADIGDFLRRTLDAIQKPAVSLRDESESVRAYARVLGASMLPGLSLDVSIPPGMLDDEVPNGVLRAALDAVLSDNGVVVPDVRLTVVSERGAMLVRATVVSPEHLSSATQPEKGPLAEYQAQGLVELLEIESHALRFRIPSEAFSA